MFLEVREFSGHFFPAQSETVQAHDPADMGEEFQDRPKSLRMNI